MKYSTLGILLLIAFLENAYSAPKKAFSSMRLGVRRAVLACAMSFLLISASPAYAETKSISKKVKSACGKILRTTALTTAIVLPASLVVPKQVFSEKSLPKKELISAIEDGGSVIENLIQVLPREDLPYFGTGGIFHKPFDGWVTLERVQIEPIVEDLAWRLKFNKYYKDGIARDAFRYDVRKLIYIMKKMNVTTINRNQLKKAADTRMRELRASGAVGEWYEIQSIHRARLLTSWKEMVVVSAKDQQAIDDLFAVPLEKQKNLNDAELALVQSEYLTRDEIRELRAIRKATELFEKATYLKNDMSGGLLNNIKSELGVGERQQVCSDEAETYRLFIGVLRKRGLIKYFDATGKISREDAVLSGHQATLLINRRNGKMLVLDSWHEHGGTAAHIVTHEDWLKENDFNDVVQLVDSK